MANVAQDQVSAPEDHENNQGNELDGQALPNEIAVKCSGLRLECMDSGIKWK